LKVGRHDLGEMSLPKVMGGESLSHLAGAEQKQGLARWAILPGQKFVFRFASDVYDWSLFRYLPFYVLWIHFIWVLVYG
jgi:hypothetical protein